VAAAAREGTERRFPAAWPARAGLSCVLVLALVLRLARIEHSGFLTPYYAAAVRSMSENWHNFLFASFDPEGFLAVDKPPVAFWIQAAWVKLFGFDGLGLRLPQVFEGVAAIGLLYHLVARRFGAGAGLLAALFLAVTPLSIAVDRSNNTDGCLVLTMLLAAWPLLLAAERGRLGWLLLAAVALGIGFNVKMLAAMVVAPAFIAVYWLGAPISRRRRLAHLVAAGLVLGAVSLSWPLLDELTPPDERPYVDSTRENSVLELAIGHNAMDRFIRPAWRRGGFREPQSGAGTGAGAGAAAPRVFGGVPAGPLRLADPRLASQLAWLFPLALAGLALGLRGPRMTLPLDASRQSVAFWSVWVLSCAAVYSSAGGIFQPYYLAPLAPALAALAAIGVTRLRTPASIIAALLVTAAWQAMIVWGIAPLTNLKLWIGAIPVVGALIVCGLLMLGHGRTRAALALGVIALLAAPGAWAIGTILSPSAGGAPIAHLAPAPAPRFAGGAGGRGWAVPENSRLLAFLAEHRGGARWLLATATAREAAPIIARTGAPVMAIGGFIGSIPILTTADLARLVAAGELRYVMLGPDGPGTARPGGASIALHDWILANGRAVAPEAWRADVPQRPVTHGEAQGGRRAPRLYDLAPPHPAGS
jgi:4-amino-4-deoxy-L-arabinose transferase-like glycosyltransferase